MALGLGAVVGRRAGAVAVDVVHVAGVSPARASARRIARLAPPPAGSGAVAWCASLVSA